MRPDVALGDLDDDALSRLVLHAVPDTDVGDVMPSESGAATWTPQRLRASSSRFIAAGCSRMPRRRPPSWASQAGGQHDC